MTLEQRIKRDSVNPATNLAEDIWGLAEDLYAHAQDLDVGPETLKAIKQLEEAAEGAFAHLKGEENE